MFKRSYNENAMANFEMAVQNETWGDLYNITDIHDAFSYFSDILVYYFYLYFPHRKVYVNISTNKKWVNGEVRASSTKLKNIFILKKNISQHN